MADEGPYLVLAAFCSTLMPTGEDTFVISDARFLINVPAGAQLTDYAVQAMFPPQFWLLLAGGHQAVSARVQVVLHFPSGATERLFDDPVGVGGAQRIVGAMVELTTIAWEIGLHWASVSLNDQEVTRVPLTVQVPPDPRAPNRVPA